MALQCLRLLEKTLVATISRTNQGVLTGRSHLRSFPNQAAMPRVAPDQEVVADFSKEENEEKNEIMSNVNKQVKEDKHGRLFAVIQLCGKQFKVTNEDLIIVEGYWDPQAGDKIKMEKVLLVGSSDFTLVGRPILPSSLVHVEGTVIEKSLSSIRTHFKKTPRKQFQRINFSRIPQTFVRINTVEIRREVNEKVDVEGIEGRIF
ncbi:39S ribosomal protein L21, mitochondrial [Ischnura elegans]|uniref:39S ribosomal protein L21, mitochondrial n=1 Tax=Ischnura elegans TaxID=197161 RepID=UPI001ED8A641|nr:39S ribosomal protein L21, mitochondrial [Ischnura elegans]